MNDLLVCERLATATQGNTLVLTRENVLPPFSGGQVVAGSNPVSPTKVFAVHRRFLEELKIAFFIPARGMDGNADGNPSGSRLEKFGDFLHRLVRSF